MSFLYTKYANAIENAMSTRSYGVHYSEEQSTDLDIHVHDCCEVLLCLSGGNSFLIDGKPYEVKDGDLFVLNPFEAHKLTSVPGVTFARFSILIHPDYLAKNSSKQTDLSRCFYQRGTGIANKISLSDREIFELEHRLLLFRRDFGFGDDIIKNSAINNILVLINRFFSKHGELDELPAPEDKTVMQTICYINEHFSEDLSLELLAKHAFVSVNQLCKLFKNRFGTTVAKYIVAKRITEAKKMLLQKKSVAETALACGFADYANFIRVFKKLVGVSPGKYGKS